MPNQLLGIHHITAITGDAQQNLNFYSGALGLRLVKRTVNFDDPGSYHLYYGDFAGSPGTLVTFFAWPGAHSGHTGTGEPVALAFEIPEDSIEWWRERLQSFQMTANNSEQRFGAPVLSVTDPEGMRVELIGSAAPERSQYWAASGIPEEHAISRIHSLTLNVSDVPASERLYLGNLGFLAAGQVGDRTRFAIGNGFVDAVRSKPGHGQIGAGSIHHVAFRAADDASQLQWLSKLTELGMGVSPVMDRSYFHSIYFREPNGVLFEIATDGPGFAVDEPLEQLGENLMLPAQYESYRVKLQGVLPPLTLPHFEAARS